jgi:formylglycine-generating enzyme required for sulfatase activity
VKGIDGSAFGGAVGDRAMIAALLHSKTALKIGFAFAVPLAAAGVSSAPQRASANRVIANETVRVPPAAFSYRAAGEFNRERVSVNAPVLQLRRDAPVVIMKSQVTEAAFEECVRDGACRALARQSMARLDVPVSGVSWEDATAYARWLSSRTGQVWRLPTDEEWVFVAGSRVRDDTTETVSDDFSQRWLAKYERESTRDRTGDRRTRKVGSFGANEHGLLDVAGNVWEWTDSCFVRQALDVANRPTGEPTTNCGVRVVEGAHRTYATSFLRDARAGGCSVGTPPDNLGFRLVRDEGSWFGRLVASLKRLRPIG